MENTIILELFQPFAQFRNPFTFFYGQTYPLPPKSTIIGMFQNITNCFYNESFFDLNISINGSFESLFWNYQNLIKSPKGIKLMKYKGKTKLWNQEKTNLKKPLYSNGLKSQRSPISQQELFNGHLFIFVRGNENILNFIKNSLLKPKKISYLGRSEDIFFVKNIFSDADFIFSCSDVKKNIWMNQPSYIKYKNGKNDIFPIKGSNCPVYSIPTKSIFKNNDNTINNKSQLNPSTKRITNFETVIHTGLNQNLSLKNKIEVEKFNITDDRNLVFKIPKDYGWL